MKEKKLGIGTRLLHGYQRFEKTESHIAPLHLSSSHNYSTVEESVHVFSGETDGHVYARYGNPNVDAVAAKIAELETMDMDEEGRGIFTSNGMSAIYTLIRALMKEDDILLTQGDLYGGTTELFRKVMFEKNGNLCITDFHNMNAVEEVLKKQPKISVIYLETPTNPMCTCIDLEAVAILGKKYHCITIVDNTFCTPYLQRPLARGIDYVLHSTTKYMNGHGTGLGGCIVGRASNAHWERIYEVMKLTGSTGNPLDAWMVSHGLKTLKLRMDQHCKNAQALVTLLSKHPKVQRVYYPGLRENTYFDVARINMDQPGGMLSFDVGSQEKAFRVMNHLSIATIAPTLGDVDTLVLHPYTSSHLRVDEPSKAHYGITPGLIRVSVGIEDTQDILDDFDEALLMI